MSPKIFASLLCPLVSFHVFGFLLLTIFGMVWKLTTFSCFSCFLVTHYITDLYFYAVLEKTFAYSLIFLMLQQLKKNDILIRKIKQQRMCSIAPPTPQ